jgi:hypothetical protein
MATKAIVTKLQARREKASKAVFAAAPTIPPGSGIASIWRLLRCAMPTTQRTAR